MKIDELIDGFDEGQLARDSLKYFMLYTDPTSENIEGGYMLKDYHKKIIEVLERVERGELKRVMINVPPQHGKSMLSSIGFPAWYLGRHPHHKVGVISYSAELSEGFSKDCRELIKTEEYKTLFGDVLHPESQSVSEWHTKNMGGYRAVGVSGSYTGKKADIIVIDDVHKDHEEAMSDLQRNKVWNWYTSVIGSRLRINTAVIIVMTRWHEDDLCGRLLERQRDNWYVLNIPVFNDDGSVIRPEIQPKELIDEKRESGGEAEFQALYMGDPVNEGGGDFKQEYFRYYERGDIIENNQFKRDMQVVTFIDPAISQKQTADYTAIVTVGLDKYNNQLYVLDIRRDRMLPKDIIDNVFNVVNEWGPSKVGIETNQFQKMLELEIRKEMNIRGKFFNLEGIPSRMNKEAKINTALVGRYQQANIFHLKGGMYVNELEAQCLKFPNGKHDDMCFVGDTKIITITGYKNIKDIKKGDYVYTPYGFRKVLASGCTGYTNVISNLGLTGTPNHNVYVLGKGTCKLKDITYIDNVSIFTLSNILQWRLKKLLSSMERPISLCDEKESIILNTTQRTSEELELSDYTSLFGNLIREKKYLRGMLFIIKMVTHLIMSLVIWSWLKIVNTFQNIGKSIFQSLKTKLNNWNILKIFAPKHQSDINQKSEENGIRSIMKILKTDFIHNMKVSVPFVVKNIGVKEKTKLNSAQTVVCKNITTGSECEEYQKYAQSVEKNIIHQKETQLKLVDELVHTNEERYVYNITVEGGHCYYANDILVANCDALAMSTMLLDSYSPHYRGKPKMVVMDYSKYL